MASSPNFSFLNLSISLLKTHPSTPTNLIRFCKLFGLYMSHDMQILTIIPKHKQIWIYNPKHRLIWIYIYIPKWPVGIWVEATVWGGDKLVLSLCGIFWIGDKNINCNLSLPWKPREREKKTKKCLPLRSKLYFPQTPIIFRDEPCLL